MHASHNPDVSLHVNEQNQTPVPMNKGKEPLSGRKEEVEERLLIFGRSLGRLLLPTQPLKTGQ